MLLSTEEKFASVSAELADAKALVRDLHLALNIERQVVADLREDLGKRVEQCEDLAEKRRVMERSRTTGSRSLRTSRRVTTLRPGGMLVMSGLFAVAKSVRSA